jgi:hypothetical protein
MVHSTAPYALSVLVVVSGLLASSVLRRKFLNPEKSLWNCFLNTCLSPLRLLKLGPYRHPITLENAITSATKQTGLSDFGGSKFVGNYAVIMDGPEQGKLRYHNIGYVMAQLELNMTMVRRLRMEQYLKEAPQVLQIGVNKPVFVVGLPRTGTTYLHRLLSLDPAARAPLLWELLQPVPGVLEKDGAGKVEFIKDAKERAEGVRKQIQMRKEVGDRALEHIHEVVYDAPEECLMAMSDEIPCLSQHFYAVYMDSKRFFREVDSAAVVDCYKRYRKVLQLLSYQTGDFKGQHRWMLKSPIHLFYIKELAAAFPDATIIW